MRGELPDDYEHALTTQFERAFKDDHGDVFVDAGAHCGTWTLRLAPLFENVVSFEPHPDSCETLRREVPPNVTVMQCGLSRHTGNGTLFLYDMPGHSAIDRSPVMSGVECTGQIEIRTLSLDELELPGKLDLLKIDTEGYELEVLEGARETIRRDRPRLCIENHSLELRQRALDFLAAIDIFDVVIWPEESKRHPTEGGYLIRI